MVTLDGARTWTNGRRSSRRNGCLHREDAPFDAIIITAAPPSVPQPLEAQLAVGGRLVVPVGTGVQDLWVWTRTESGLDKRNVLPVRFVPMTGRAQQPTAGRH